MQFVRDLLAIDGYINRNRCLRNHISRLASIIGILAKYEDYEFINWSKTRGVVRLGRREDVGYGNKDYVYTLETKSFKKKHI